MVALRLEDFRLRAGVTEDVLGTELCLSKIASAQEMSQRIAGRVFGHAIELVEADGDDALIRVYRHGLPASGKVYLSGLNIAGLTGIVSYTREDIDSIRVADVTVAQTIEGEGMLAMPYTKDVDLLDQTIRLGPGPLAAVEEMRVCGSNWEDDGGFGTAQIIDPTLWYMNKDGRYNWANEVHVSDRVDIRSTRRRPGMINSVRVTARRKVRATYYLGCVESVPEDILEAIAAIAMKLVNDPLGDQGSESYDYYSVTRTNAYEIALMPTTAVSTLIRYRPLLE